MPAALVTGVSRRRGIGAAVAERLRADGWRVFTTGWRAYDDEMPWGSDAGQAVDLEADLADPAAPQRVIDAAEAALGALSGLALVHTVDLGGGLADMNVGLIDRHMAVNVRATMLLMQEFAFRFSSPHGTGRIVLFTSAPPQLGAIAYAASKGAVEWVTRSSAAELGPKGITVNAVNPGPTQTGWMALEVERHVAAQTPLGRVGTPSDVAAVVSFLMSPDAAWINGQIISSDGGYSSAAVT
jgi:3-oxoacyl-[acyl-carrier protein] reductase